MSANSIPKKHTARKYSTSVTHLGIVIAACGCGTNIARCHQAQEKEQRKDVPFWCTWWLYELILARSRNTKAFVRAVIKNRREFYHDKEHSHHRKTCCWDVKLGYLWHDWQRRKPKRLLRREIEYKEFSNEICIWYWYFILTCSNLNAPPITARIIIMSHMRRKWTEELLFIEITFEPREFVSFLIAIQNCLQSEKPSWRHMAMIWDTDSKMRAKVLFVRNWRESGRNIKDSYTHIQVFRYHFLGLFSVKFQF